MAEYLVKTDKPIRLDEVLHLHGVHHYEVKRLGKHGRLCDLDALIEHETYNIEQALFDSDEVLDDLKNTPVIVEANNGTDN